MASGTSAGWPGWLLLLPAAFSVFYWLCTARWLRLRFQGDPSPAGPAGSAVFFRPVKKGVPGLGEKAERLVACASPGDQVLFGVDCEEDAEACRAACRGAGPGVAVQVLLCPPPSESSPNPKIAKLAALAALADPRTGAWILTDSEAVLDRGWMDRFRAEWAVQKGALTAGYRFTGETNLPQRFDHLSILLTLWPGLAAAEKGGPLRFTLGACTALHRADLARLGGWERFAAFLAEDYQLGRALAREGVPVRLAREVLVLDSDPLTWPALVRHQHRVTLTYRVCNPAGALGMLLTHGVFFALFTAALHPASLWGWAACALVLLVRTATARQNARHLGIRTSASWLSFTAAIALLSLAETAFWFAAWLPLPVRWGSRRLQILEGGRIREISPPRP